MDTILEKKSKVQQILNVFETGSITGDYSNVSIFADGPGDRRQITYGRSQTTEWGHLPKLIQEYVDAKGKVADFFKPYLSKLGKVSLVNDSALISKLKEAGKDPIMQSTQDVFFDEHYWAPAFKFMQTNGFKLPLSAMTASSS